MQPGSPSNVFQALTPSSPHLATQGPDFKRYATTGTSHLCQPQFLPPYPVLTLHSAALVQHPFPHPLPCPQSPARPSSMHSMSHGSCSPIHPTQGYCVVPTGNAGQLKGFCVCRQATELPCGLGVHLDKSETKPQPLLKSEYD